VCAAINVLWGWKEESTITVIITAATEFCAAAEYNKFVQNI
jgi:hypothetical protein